MKNKKHSKKFGTNKNQSKKLSKEQKIILRNWDRMKILYRNLIWNNENLKKNLLKQSYSQEISFGTNNSKEFSNETNKFEESSYGSKKYL